MKKDVLNFITAVLGIPVFLTSSWLVHALTIPLPQIEDVIEIQTSTPIVEEVVTEPVQEIAEVPVVEKVKTSTPVPTPKTPPTPAPIAPKPVVTTVKPDVVVKAAPKVEKKKSRRTRAS